MKDYVFFTNNETESFNHLINQCISSNIKVSFNKFEDMLKFILIRIEGLNNGRSTQKTLVSDILRDLIGKGFGKNN